MPELPEVERAVQQLRGAVTARVMTAVRVLHPSLRRRLPPRLARTLVGARISHVERRGKHQLLWLDDGRVLHAHFRMTGDWNIGRTVDPLPRFARFVLDLDDGRRVVLEDSRALATLELHPADAPPALALGPEPMDAALTAEFLAASLAKRRGQIKPALLDQRVIAGLGNIYAAEALWRSRISPRAKSSSLSPDRVGRLIAAIRSVIRRATGARYGASDAARFDVYDREGMRCRRCGASVRRIVQAGRSTYWCGGCQV
jgi:formamidopyrimidine-DNA glycosylase